MPRFRVVSAFGVFVAVLSCSGSSEHANPYVVRDSAGLVITESSAPRWSEDEAWEIESQPTFDLSGLNDDQLSNPRSPRRLNNGQLVLYNAGACEIRIYDETPNVLSSWGNCGNGPGEFENFTGLWSWQGDSLLVVDQIPSRISIFDRHGGLGRTLLMPVAADAPVSFASGVLDDGTIVTSGERNSTVPREAGVRESERSLALIRHLSEAPVPIGVFPGSIWEYAEFRGRLTRGRLAFSSTTVTALYNDRIFIGFQDRYEIHVLDEVGSVRRIVRRSHDLVRVEQRDIDWLMARRLDEVEGRENEQLVRQSYRDLRHAEFMPAFGVPTWPGATERGPSLLADEEGNLWVFNHYRPGEYRNRWTVFSPDGVWLGGVSLPDHLVPVQIGDDVVIGLWRDDDGFVHVRQHRLIRS